MIYRVSPNIAGLIFDFDGTIVDSMPIHYQSWQQAFNDFDAPFSEKFFYDHAGLPLHTVVEAYNRTYAKTLCSTDVISRKNLYHIDHLPQTQPIPPVLDIITHYHGVLPMAVATGNSRSLTLPVMDRLKLTDLFEIVVFGEDVSQGKPHPESFLKAAAALQIPPQKCEVFEDGDPGIEAAKRAGMKATDIRPWLTA